MEPDSSNRVPKLALRVRLAYATGHVMNDLTSTLWFTYLLVYAHEVVQFSDTLAGSLLLLGQIVDAASTPIIGFASDAMARGICGYGKRKSWHLLGSVCVAISCPFLYITCLPCTAGTPDSLRFLYYATFISLFQFGWAAVQTAHLAMIPELSCDPGVRTELGAWRNAMCVFSSVIVYALAFFLLSKSPDPTNPPQNNSTFTTTVTTSPMSFTSTSPISNSTMTASAVSATGDQEFGRMHLIFGSSALHNFGNSSSSVTPADAGAFAYLAVTTVGIGLVFTVLFHILVPEGKFQRSFKRPDPCSEVDPLLDSNRVKLHNEQSINDDDEPLLRDGDINSGSQSFAGVPDASDSDMINEAPDWESQQTVQSASYVYGDSINGDSINGDSERPPVLQNSTTLDVPEPAKKEVKLMRWFDWFKEPQYWLVGILWALTRMLYNLPQVYLPLFVLDTLFADKTSIAIVPLVIYISGFVTSLGMKKLNEVAGRKLSYVLGLVVVGGFTVWSYFLPPFGTNLYPMVYAVAVLLGIGCTCVLVTSVAMTADLIGCRVETSAFVYGTMSLLDKLSNGATVQILQVLKPPDSDPNNAAFLRNIESFVIGGVAVAALITLCILIPQKIGRLRRCRAAAKAALLAASHNTVAA